MNSPAMEAFLARLYVEPELRARFLADPAGECRRAGLSDEQCAAMEKIDRTGLALAAESFRRKREKSGAPSAGRPSLWRRIFGR